MISLPKKAIIFLILLSLLTAATFGFVAMTHGSDGKMAGNCPFSAAGQSPCPQDLMASAIYHLSSYNSFFNVPVGENITISIISLLFIVFVLLPVFIRLYSPPLLARSVISHDSPSPHFHNEKIIGWLSLFEHSPSSR